MPSLEKALVHPRPLPFLTPSLPCPCSTIDPGMSKTVFKGASSVGVSFADAPVSGGTPGAEKATLTFMVGCQDQVYDEVQVKSTALLPLFHRAFA